MQVSRSTGARSTTHGSQHILYRQNENLNQSAVLDRDADNRASDVDQNAVNLTQEVQQGEPVQIASKAPKRPKANSASYTCLFGFRQYLNKKKASDNIVKITDYDTSGYDYYFMAGTNTEGTPIFFKSGTQLEKTGDQLSTYASKTENMTYVNPFTNFPYERSTSLSDSGRRWHPVKHYCNKEKYSGVC